MRTNGNAVPGVAVCSPAGRDAAATDRQTAAPGIAFPRRFQREDFNGPTLRVARDLLGKILVRARGKRMLFGMITEVEAYKGPRDLASHAARGRRTERVEPLYCDGGTIYVYLVYGIHWLLNFSTAGAGRPEGVLIRGVLADPRGERRPISGPGRVTQYLDIDKRLDGRDATTSMQLWIEDWDMRIPARSIKTGPRVGVDYAGPYWAARPWRFRIDSAHAETLL